MHNENWLTDTGFQQYQRGELANSGLLQEYHHGRQRGRIIDRGYRQASACFRSITRKRETASKAPVDHGWLLHHPRATTARMPQQFAVNLEQVEFLYRTALGIIDVPGFHGHCRPNTI